jgi:hypothetical protein
MSKKESRVAVQVVGVHGAEAVEGLYVLASDGSIWKLSEFKDLAAGRPGRPKGSNVAANIRPTNRLVAEMLEHRWHEKVFRAWPL